jgi:thymidylate synthase
MILATQYDDVNLAYYELQYTKKHHVRREETRNGPALVFQTPVCVTHVMPYRRVLFDPIRDANPFFHYMEAIWMLAGSENVDFPSKFAKQIRQYSDDGVRLYGAYGHRWRHAFDVDQIDEVIEKFKKDPFTRRAVISMYDPIYDTNYSGKDLPCNTHIYFRNMYGRLDMTVCNRSNDLVWGMLGANMVHFSVLMEYIAEALNMTMGAYHQFTNNLHVYDGWQDRYYHEVDPFYKEQGALPRIPFGPDSLDWSEAAEFVEYGEVDMNLKSPILQQNAFPMLQAWNAHKEGDDPLARHYAEKIYDGDWSKACIEWLDRRVLK